MTLAFAKLRKRVNKRLVQVQNSYLRNSRVFGHPFQLTLESGNVCNLKCPLCPTTWREKEIPTGVLRFENARRIIDSFPYTVQLVLSNWGEPFLNKDIFRIIEHAKSRDIEVRIESNLGLFNRESCENLVASGLDTLVVALDGASQETYEAYRVGGVYADVVRNVEMLREVQAQRDDFRTTLIWKMVVNHYNEHEVDEARKQAEALGMGFEEVTIWIPKNTPSWLPGSKSMAGSRAENGTPSKCHNLWQTVSVNFNGDVFPCCSEFAPSDRVINVLEEPFGPAWNAEEYRERRRLNKGVVNCASCHGDKDTRWYRTWMGTESVDDVAELALK